MPGILWFGNPYFSRHLQALGREVHHVPVKAPRAFSWTDVLELHGAPPEVVVFGDNSMPPLLVGVEDFPCATAFFCVDSHIHSWHPYYAQAFDLCCVSLKDNLPRFEGRLTGEQLRWMPLWADAGSAPPVVAEEDKEYEALFVGNVNPETMPGRHAFFQELQRRLPSLTVMQGKYKELFPKAKVVLNYAERGDLNFRVFQALGCRSFLVTPDVGHGQSELFREGEELFSFAPEDMDGMIGLIEKLLADRQLRERVAAQGLAAIDKGHRANHRAAAFDAWLRSFDLPALVAKRKSMTTEIRRRWMKVLFLHLAEGLGGELREIYMQQARRNIG